MDPQKFFGSGYTLILIWQRGFHFEVIFRPVQTLQVQIYDDGFSGTIWSPKGTCNQARQSIERAFPDVFLLPWVANAANRLLDCLFYSALAEVGNNGVDSAASCV
jgi:hypothetical protein